jgi:hypothetical protein
MTTTKSVTLECNADPTLIGDNATREELAAYHANLSELIEREFGVEVHRVRSNNRDACPESEEITARIREIESGDEWTQLL